MDDKFILMDMNDERTKKVAEVMGNATCKKIIEFLAEIKEASEKDISDALGIPLNTAEYNLKKLIESGLAEKTKNFFWSTKGKKIEMFKLANKHIVISPKPKKRPDMNALKTILPIMVIALTALLVVIFMFPRSKEIFVGTNVSISANDSQLKHFSSYDELKDFVNQSYEGRGYYGAEDMMVKANLGAPTAMAVESVGGGRSSEFSTTNIQVEGVDEPDIVKNDGKYIYAVSGNKVVIVNAYPAENMEILSEIDLNKSVSEIFINEDKLIVFASGYDYAPYSSVKCLEYGYTEYKGGCGGDYNYQSLVYIYDVSDRENPELEDNISIEGNYVDSRMIGDYVYVISTKYIDSRNPEPPVYIMNGVETKIAAEDVYYWPYYDTSYVFTSISAINVEDGETTSKVFLTGSTGTTYVSQDNIYLTYQKRMDYRERFRRQAEEVYLTLLPEEEKGKIEEIMENDKLDYNEQNEISKIVQEYSGSLIGAEKAEFDSGLLKALEDFEVKIEKETEKTAVHKINVDKEDIEYRGVGEVPGHILNQFSMDEYNGNFRITTTTGEVWGGNSLNHLYILDEDLGIVGRLEDLAEGERIYSVRFMGKRCYLVTFEAIDPLFVIDLSEPENPKVLGYLKIPGYSDYLHPYDENHVIGIGRDVNASIDEEKVHSSHAVYYTAVLGVKVSLFDVSDVANPIEEDKFVIGERGTESPVLSDHKAFLFDKKKNLLVLPVNVAELVKGSNQWGEYENSEIIWQGAYVFNIDESGIELKGKITHDDNIGTESYYPNYKYSIQRSLYMDNVLYTISNSKVKANNLDSVEEISSVELPYEQEYYYPYYAMIE